MYGTKSREMQRSAERQGERNMEQSPETHRYLERDKARGRDLETERWTRRGNK